jgi:hypothetical protein
LGAVSHRPRSLRNHIASTKNLVAQLGSDSGA